MEYLYGVVQEFDGEFSLYDGESGNFMSHYATIEGIIDRFKIDSALDGSTYRVEFNMNDGMNLVYVIVSAS